MFSKPAGSCSKDRTRPCSRTTASAASTWGCEKPERREESMPREYRLLLAAALIGAAAAVLPVGVSAQQPKEGEIAMSGPLSGPWAPHVVLERFGAEMAIADLNKSGGLKSTGGAKIHIIISR